MWACKKCGGEILIWEDENVTTKYKMHKNKKNPTKGKKIKYSEIGQTALTGYECKECGNDISDQSGVIEEIAEWINKK